MARFRIGIVGFGVAGATSALLLAEQGHEVHLFERAPHVGPVGAGILLMQSGQIILRRIGLLDEIAARGESIERLSAWTHRGHTLIDLPFGEVEPGLSAFGLHRGDLFESLHTRVVASGAQIHLDHEITARQLEAGRAFLLDDQGGRHGPFDFVLAGDGARSTLRSSLNWERSVHEYDYGALWAIGRSGAVRRKLHQVVRGTKRLLGLLPMGSDRCSLFWSLNRDEVYALRDRGFADWRAEVLALCPLAAELFESVTSFEQTTFTTYVHVRMRRWFDIHTLLLGDAAHAMSPHLGQGVNLALIDAYTFADCLARGGDFRTACRAYTVARAAQLRYYGWLTYALTPFFQSRGWLLGLGRDLALPVMTRLPILRGQMLISMAGLKGGFTKGKAKL